MSHAEWLERYNARVQPLFDRANRLPDEITRPWWAPECPDEPPAQSASISARGLVYDWYGHPVDIDMKPGWVARLNALPNVEITHVCAGHQSGQGMLFPSLDFAIMHPDIKGGNGDGDLVNRLISEDFGDLADAVAWETLPSGAGGYAGFPGKIICMIWSWVPREWMSHCEFVSWWEQVIGRLEDWTRFLPEMVREGS